MYTTHFSLAIFAYVYIRARARTHNLRWQILSSYSIVQVGDRKKNTHPHSQESYSRTRSELCWIQLRWKETFKVYRDKFITIDFGISSKLRCWYQRKISYIDTRFRTSILIIPMHFRTTTKKQLESKRHLRNNFGNLS
jgi:hypothetical protein